MMNCACFLLAQARGNGAVMPNVAEKLVFGVQKTLKFKEISVKINIFTKQVEN